MTSTPLISCIVPVFNGERYLSEALDSIIHQTCRWTPEIIVVDDGSTDGSATVVGKYADSVRYIRQDNKGPATARNRGLQEAQGQFVGFLDQDDLWHSEKLERQMARFADRPDLDLCVTHAAVFFASELGVKAVQFRNPRLSRPQPGYLMGTLLARRIVFEAVGLLNPGLRYGDAADWFVRAADLGLKMELLPEVLMHHRIHEGNYSRLNIAASQYEFLEILKASLDRRRAVGSGVASSYNFTSGRSGLGQFHNG